MNTLALKRTAAARRLAWRMPLGLALPAVLLLAAEGGVRSGLIPANLLPAPSDIAHTLAWLVHNGLAGHVSSSSARVLAGFAAGASLAVLLGAAVALNRRAEGLLDPSFQALRAIPSLAWVPLLLLWFGIDETPKLVLIAIGAFFPVYMGVVSGIGGADRKLIEVAQLYRLNRIALARRADIVLAAIVLLALLGKASDSLMLALENHLLSWRDSYANRKGV